MSEATTSVVLSRIVRDPSFQVRNKLDQATISRYVDIYEAGNEMPPIRVAVVDDVPIVSGARGPLRLDLEGSALL